MDDKQHAVYILECKDGTYYTGYTNELPRRLAMHESGKGAKYTRGRGPLKLRFHAVFASKQEALQAEYAIKRMDRKRKEKLIQEGGMHDVEAEQL
ncbi:GIY-YIG nuclease family protein [Fictibacillus iocasae]|uniref:GIY-YIG nuclease family protein n=1 Tax=Fictibacillus iocasae TaxID=2715437 RepID=A0ABW2NQ60_9BACL